MPTICQSKKITDIKLRIWRLNFVRIPLQLKYQPKTNKIMIKKLIILAVVSLLSLSTFAAQDNPPSESTGIDLDVDGKSETTKTHRAPLHLNLHAWYNQQENTIEIECLDNYEGEVFLIRDGVTIDYSPMINTSFNLPEYNGLYTIIIESETWTARGSVSL